MGLHDTRLAAKALIVVGAGSGIGAATVERLCSDTPVVDTLRQCLVKQVLQTESSREGVERPDPPNTRQFRVTVRVIGPKDTQVWTQALVTKEVVSP